MLKGWPDARRSATPHVCHQPRCGTSRRMPFKIVLLPGDGVGPEVVQQAKAVLVAVGRLSNQAFSFETCLMGGIAIDETGEALPAETLAACQRSDAVLLGAVGGPKWDNPKAKTRPEMGLLGIRRGLGLYANLRPVRGYKELLASSPLKPERVEGVDLLVVRELTGGLYFGAKYREDTKQGVRVVDTLEYHAFEIERIVRLAFEIARGRKKKVTSVDKANVLESSRLWREIATDMAARFPAIALEHQLVDS